MAQQEALAARLRAAEQEAAALAGQLAAAEEEAAVAAEEAEALRTSLDQLTCGDVAGVARSELAALSSLRGQAAILQAELAAARAQATEAAHAREAMEAALAANGETLALLRDQLAAAAAAAMAEGERGAQRLAAAQGDVADLRARVRPFRSLRRAVLTTVLTTSCRAGASCTEAFVAVLRGVASQATLLFACAQVQTLEAEVDALRLAAQGGRAKVTADITYPTAFRYERTT